MSKRNNYQHQRRESHTPGQPAPLPPTVEGNKNGEGDDRRGDRISKTKYTEKPAHWTAYIEAACAVLLVVITAMYTHYAYEQAGAGITAAEAAKTSADTANESLHISERAYIAVKNEALDWKGKGITFNIENVGHIPTGRATILTHEALVRAGSDGLTDILKDSIEHYWTLGYRQSMDPGSPIFAGGPSLSRFDRREISAGHQGVSVMRPPNNSGSHEFPG